MSVLCAPMMNLVLAQDAPSLAGSPTPTTPSTGTPAGPANSGPGTGAPAGNGGLLLFAPILILWIVIMFWHSRRDAKRKRALLEGVKKHDRVQMTGGIIGSVAELKPDLVVLKIDENTNTRMTFARSAIVAILKESPVDTAKDAGPVTK